MSGGFLSGYKTYVLAAIAVIGAVAGWAVGDLTTAQALEMIWSGGVAATIRSAISKP